MTRSGAQPAMYSVLVCLLSWSCLVSLSLLSSGVQSRVVQSIRTPYTTREKGVQRVAQHLSWSVWPGLVWSDADRYYTRPDHICDYCSCIHVSLSCIRRLIFLLLGGRGGASCTVPWLAGRSLSWLAGWLAGAGLAGVSERKKRNPE